MNRTLFLLIGLVSSLVLSTQSQADIMEKGKSKNHMRDFREVLTGVLWRAGSNENNKHIPLSGDQLKGLCEENFGTSFYLYSSGMSGPMDIKCANGTLHYQANPWQKSTTAAIVNEKILESIRTTGKPVLVHCWNGVHATGLLATTALIQFCEVPLAKAIKYSYVGVGDIKTLENKIIPLIKDFKRNTDPDFQLSEGEKNRVCPKF